MKDYFYTQYICKLKKDTTDANIEGRLKCIGNSPYIYRVDVTGEPKDEQTSFINKVISAERLRLYSDTSSLFFVNVIKAYDDRFIIILSICENLITPEEKKRLLHSLFIDDTVSAITLYGNKKASASESTNYWSEAFKLYRLNIPIQKRELSDDFYSENFDIPDKLKPYISECINTKKKSLKVMLEMAIGRLACKGIGVEKVLINDIHEGGNISGIPLFFNGKESDADLYESIKEQLIQAEYNDTITDELLKKAINLNLDNVPMVSFYYMHDKKYDYFIGHMVEGRVYSIGALNALEVGLTVIFKVTEAELDVSYIYNSNLFKNVDISVVHDFVMKMLEAAFSNDDSVKSEVEAIDSEPKVQEDAVDINSLRRYQLKLSCINQIKIFEGLDEEAKKLLAKNSTFVTASSERHFAMSGEGMNKLFFIVNGTVAVMGIDKNKYLCPLYALRTGQVFGIESLLDDNKASVCYSVHDDKILLLQVDADFMRKFASKHSDIYIKLMGELRSRLVKLEKLWLTV